MVVAKAQADGATARLRKRAKPAAKPSLNAPPKAYVARPGGPIDYDALSAAASGRFPRILKRLAE
jgi:hypothetical protein